MNLNGCETWCGLNYDSDSVPVLSHEKTGFFGLRRYGGPVYCTAACRDRASSKVSECQFSGCRSGYSPCSQHAKASAPTVELAKGWVKAATLGKKRFDDKEYPWLCTSPGPRRHRSGEPAAYYVDGMECIGACEACAPAMGVFASPVTDDTEPREPGCQCHREIGDSPCRVHGDEGDARHPEPVVCAHVGCGRTGAHEHDDRGTFRGIIIEEYGAPLPQWLTDERALMQSAPPVMVLPEFPRSKIERDNAHLRPVFQRSPRYVRGGR